MKKEGKEKKEKMKKEDDMVAALTYVLNAMSEEIAEDILTRECFCKREPFKKLILSRP